MTSILDRAPFPWHEPAAAALHEALCQLYPTGKRALYLVERAGIAGYLVNADQPAFELWFEVLNLAATAQRTRALATLARDLNPTSAHHAFLGDLVADRAPALPADARTPDGKAGFDDRISEPEALLFHDDLTLSIGRVPALVATLQHLLALAPAVCRLEARFGGDVRRTTAFRIGADLLLTNWHSLHHAGLPASAVTAELGYDDDATGHGLAATPIRCAIASIVADAIDDWGVIRAAEPLPAAAPVLDLAAAAEPIVREAAFVIQHPAGERKRIGFVRNTITDVTPHRLYYLTDTQAGSSGSPVLDAAGRLIGLHRAGGSPQEVAGRPPLKKNEGVRIPRILDGLRAAKLF